MARTLLSKKEFMEKYELGDTKYSERMEAMRREPNFEQGYITPTHKEVWIDEDIYQEFLIFLSNKRKKKLFNQ